MPTPIILPAHTIADAIDALNQPPTADDYLDAARTLSAILVANAEEADDDDLVYTAANGNGEMAIWRDRTAQGLEPKELVDQHEVDPAVWVLLTTHPAVVFGNAKRQAASL